MRQIVVHWTGGMPGYGDARVDGRFAISRPAPVPGSTDKVEIVTDTGPVPQFENRAAYFLRVANSGDRFAAAYSSAQPDRAKERTGFGWVDRGLVCGTNPVIYDASNSLVVVARCAPPTGSQGWRYLDESSGQLITSDSTYADPSKQLWEYTKWPDIWIGQGQSGVKVWTPDLGTRPFSFEALRSTGNLRFVRARRVGDDFALTVVDLDQHLTTATWATLADLCGQPAPPPTNPPCKYCGQLKAAHLSAVLICPNSVYTAS